MKTNTVLLSSNRKAACQASVQDIGVGAFSPFPGRTAVMLTPEIRSSLVKLVFSMLGMHPIVFDADEVGNEVCRMANHVTIGWDCKQCLYLSDMRSGFVDHGPFRTVDEIFDLIAYIGVLWVSSGFRR